MRYPDSLRHRLTLGALLISAAVLSAATVGAAAAVVAARVAQSYQVSTPTDICSDCPDQGADTSQAVDPALVDVYDLAFGDNCCS